MIICVDKVNLFVKWLNTEMDRQTDGWTDGQTDKQMGVWISEGIENTASL